MDDDDEEDVTRRATTPSLHPPSMGRVAFAAWWDVKVKGPVFCLPPRWDELPQIDRDAWEAAAKSICG